MKPKYLFDAFIVSGFVASLFNGFLNPLYVSMILVRLDPRVIAAGSFMASGFPVLIGAALGNRLLFRRLYAALPGIMLMELALAALAIALAAVDVQAYYLASMLILGVFSSSVIFLLQKMKEDGYRWRRAAFDRRVQMADGLGFLTGSGLAVVGVSVFRDPLSVASLGALQTAVVYGLFLLLRRALTPRAGRSVDKEPHPWRSPAVPARHAVLRAPSALGVPAALTVAA
jgi:hypothetical protein